VFPAALAEELIAHALQDEPNECCGMIAGRDGVATRILRATNTEASPFMYVMDPREQLDIMDRIDEADEEMLGIYHSHTRSAAYPSRTDVELAFFPLVAYVIVSLSQKEPVIRAYRLTRTAPDGQQVDEIPIEIR